MNYGLKEETIEKIQNVFTAFPEIDAVLLYGSRAKGNFKTGSDIDLVLKGSNLSLKILNNISLQLDELYLPYTFDLSVYSHIKNPELIEQIDHAGIELYSRLAVETGKR